ncbi:phospholipase [Stipitochalara longipes BDJ]|nr:phospholipase [Stipitochalara longipes BDJ]
MAQTQAIVTAQGDPLEREGRCILSLDGGGVRGLSSLLIIKALMAKVNAERKKDGQDAVKPCELFDLIGGTSTGGIIAIMLGRLEMDVDDCIKEYTSMFEVIFAQKGLTVTLWGKLKGRFDSTVLEQCVRKILKERGLSEHEPLNDGTERCKVVVCAKAFEITTTILLRSYNSDDVLNDTSATICEAVRATSAATSFFEPVTIGPRGRKYVDGGLGGTNNPVEQLWNEAQNIWCHDSELELSTLLKCFISIGTGDPGRKPIAEGLFGFFLKTLVDLATQTEDTAKTFVDRHRRLYEKKRYFRFNVQQGLQDVGLEEYKKAGLIEAATAGYMDGQETRSSVQACAINLKQKHCIFTPILSKCYCKVE